MLERETDGNLQRRSMPNRLYAQARLSDGRVSIVYAAPIFGWPQYSQRHHGYCQAYDVAADEWAFRMETLLISADPLRRAGISFEDSS